MAAGLLLGVPFMPLGGLLLLDLTPISGLVLAAAGVVGILLGVGRWLSSPVVSEDDGFTPRSVLRRDRNALMVTVVGVTVLAGSAVWVAFSATSLSYSWTPGLYYSDPTGFTLTAAAVSGSLVLFGSGAAWLSYSIARLWLALRGQVPWRLMRFLDQAHKQGILRRAGAAYQVRHELVREHLIDRWAPAPRPGLPLLTQPGPHPRSRAAGPLRRLPALAAAIGLTLLPSAALAIDPRPAPRAPLTGHTDGVWGVAFSPDGHTLATASGDGTARLWDVDTRQPRGTPLTGHNGPVTGVAFSPDGHTLATASGDKTARLWDVDTRQPRGTPLTGHTDWVWDVAFSPDGHTLATTSWDRTARLWDVDTGQPLGIPASRHLQEVNGVAFSPDGRTLATVSDDRTVRLWDIATELLL